MNQDIRHRLDTELVARSLVSSRSQAESYIKLGKVSVNGQVINKTGYLVSASDSLKINQQIQYVNRAALKLASIVHQFNLNFEQSEVLDVGSSTGGFTDYALKHGALRVIAVEIGTDQMHHSLKTNPRVLLYEKTDILNVQPYNSRAGGLKLSFIPSLVVVDLSFISLRQILPHIRELINTQTELVVMVKPQFEALHIGLKHKGVIKNETIRRAILKEFESWVKNYFVVVNKADSKVSGSKGNLERFYLLKRFN